MNFDGNEAMRASIKTHADQFRNISLASNDNDSDDNELSVLLELFFSFCYY